MMVFCIFYKELFIEYFFEFFKVSFFFLQPSHLLSGKGYRVIERRFIGFPDKRDINTPQSLLVAH